MKDSIIDPAALNFTEGRWGTCINGQTYQQEGILSFKGYQYAAYFAHGGALSVARRKLPDSAWETFHFSDYSIAHNDTHNVAALGICERDGTLHLAFDMHCDPLHYRRSLPNVVTTPELFAWNETLFSPVTAEFEAGKPIPKLTYPHFYSTPDGKLQVLYRTGWSGHGDWFIEEYDGAWTHLGRLFSLEGTYETSLSRCAYPNPPRFDRNGRLHVSWCWREIPEGCRPDLRTNHDLCYAYSDDVGRTWHDNAGQEIAQLRGENDGLAISVLTPGIIVRNIRFLTGMMNTTTQFVDPLCRVHVVNWQLPHDVVIGGQDLSNWRYYHCVREIDGQWRETLLPFWGRKPQIAVAPNGRAYVVCTKGENANYHQYDHGGKLTIASASEKSGWTDWETVWQSEADFVGEPLLDHPRWHEAGILSIYIQEKPAAVGGPSPLHVIEWDLRA